MQASKDGEESEASISPDVIERMKMVTSVCLSYCLRLLTHDHAPGLPNDLRSDLRIIELNTRVTLKIFRTSSSRKQYSKKKLKYY